MSSFTGSVEKQPVIYIRQIEDRSYSWAALKTDVDLSDQPAICKCGARASLESCFIRTERPPINSSIAAVGSKIYTFGGVYVENKSLTDEVSCIDTLCPDEGWKIMKKMPSPLRLAYAVTIDEKRVLLVGGMDMRSSDPAAEAHMYYVDTDTCVPLYNDFQLPAMKGHGVVGEGEDKFILMYSPYSHGPYCYDLRKERWNHIWQTVLDDSLSASVLIDDIYYVLDSSLFARNQNLEFSGYDITLEDPNRLPVKVVLDERNKDEQWMPVADATGFVVHAKLLSLGNSKLAVLWNYSRLEEKHSPGRVCLRCSIFEMTKKNDGSGGLTLMALPLSNTCHHLEGYIFKSCVVVSYLSKVMDILNTSRKRKRIEWESNEESEKDLAQGPMDTSRS